MEQIFLWCYQCNQFSTNTDMICRHCNSNAVEQRQYNNQTSLQYFDANLNLLSERLAVLVHALQELTNRMSVTSNKKVPATDDMIAQIPWVDPSLHDCPICLEPQLSQVREMPCGHTYHNKCLVPWLKVQRTCPNCRFELIESK